MRKQLIYILVVALACLSCIADAAPLQSADCGSIQRTVYFSPLLGDSIPVDVWLPDSYAASGDERYPVIYMHDGQNLFDASTTWNRQSWEMDSVMCRLIAADAIRPAIIVGIHSRPEQRVGDLMPQKAVAEIAETVNAEKNVGPEGIRGDMYLRFLVETLKPDIDARYRTLPDADDTMVMGSSMGGLMSFYALCEYPEVFGAAACLSTHWIGAPEIADTFSAALGRYLAGNLPRDGRHRLYFDHGTETLDSLYGPYEEAALRIVRECGYGEPATLCCFVDTGGAHEERSWARRVERPLRFLLGRTVSVE